MRMQTREESRYILLNELQKFGSRFLSILEPSSQVPGVGACETVWFHPVHQDGGGGGARNKDVWLDWHGLCNPHGIGGG